MPGFVNIGAWVGPRTMVDTWATVGSCAQIGADVHLAGGVGIGGVLEPPQARPVIVEDGAFIGSRAIVDGGRRRRRGCRDRAERRAHGDGAHHRRDRRPSRSSIAGYVPPRSVVLPGTRVEGVSRRGAYPVSCALIVGERSASTDLRTSLNDVLAGVRDRDVTRPSTIAVHDARAGLAASTSALDATRRSVRRSLAAEDLDDGAAQDGPPSRMSTVSVPPGR